MQDASGPRAKSLQPSASSLSPARWLWVASHHYVNQHVYLRKRFELPAAPLSARIRVAADTRYRLFVNGSLVVPCGPARGFPHALPVDELDIGPCLHAGPNVIAAHVLSFGISTAQNVFRDRAGFFLEGVAECHGGATVALHSDPSWRVKEAVAFRRYANVSGSRRERIGFQEHYDAARDELAVPAAGPDWTLPAYDDAGWEEPCVLGAEGALPWRAFEPRGIPLLDAKLQAPVRVVAQWEAPANAGSFEMTCGVAAVAAQEAPVAAARQWFERPEALLAGRAVRLLPPASGRCAVLFLDFGETRYGHPVLKVSGAAGGEAFDLLYGEQGGEGDCPVPAPFVADDRTVRVGAGLADRLVCRPGGNRFESLQPRGFRHAALVARNVSRPLVIEQLALRETTYPAPQRGAFSCSDPRLNAIWETGVRTLRHCMADTFLDWPMRARQDAAATRIAGLACFHALGDAALYRRALHLMGQGLLPDGLLLGVVPSERADAALLDYSLHWIASLSEYYQFTGDGETLKEHKAALEKVLGFFAVLAGDRGLLGPTPNYASFLDHAPGLDHANRLSATLNLLYLHALRHAARIGNALGESGLASHCVRQAAALADRILMVFASSRRSLLVEAVDASTGEPGELVSQHATALAVIEAVLGKRESDQRAPVAEVLCDFLPPPGADSAPGPVRANLFFRAFVHEALALLGRSEDALMDIKRTWGHMLDQGATTWWERLPMCPDAGRCNVWSVHPTTFLSRHVLGLAPLEPGWRQFQVKPQPLGLEHAAGQVPTPHGEIGMCWRRSAPGKPLQIELTVPPETHAHVPAPGQQAPLVLASGTHRWEQPQS